MGLVDYKDDPDSSIVRRLKLYWLFDEQKNLFQF